MTIKNNTYECEICLNVNHVSKMHCSCCGAVPAAYSPTGKTVSEHRHVSCDITLNYFTPIVIARGADRAEWHRTMRTYLRTVKADYYGSSLSELRSA